ncbi:MAG: hypothetical protein IID52_00595 [Proteobacteria bacterium]|nr:hypothetical protein [Pseudomonadota bacterium]MCH8172048.1 hypothetical protein [Pseudomonadota bacterium]MCH8322375.1 hypothetical protein [Pseudomonadota bacterium]
MVNTLTNGALLGVFGYLWYWLATAAPYIGSGGDVVGSGYIFFTILAAAMLAGK